MILMVFNKEFLKWVIIANVLAWPLAWILAEQLLSNFAYRIAIPWWWFLITALFTMALSLITVSLFGVQSRH